ncbi:hypothetical protein K466DRAFT_504424 [Polyporus arcularius HHB13444]|uniref:Uncharacterized protein n=1 Tax=Polyporus arcularius HHB13444 TaxID=1314778 RepID=A0A5C3NRE3_9APHY|nr:hypothetical protein K466DRAFT_504424 [Polyporus arcularius HHB13444]
MAPKGWTRGEQQPWLQSRVPACVEARRHGRFGTWVTTVHHDWFLRWPERRELWGEWEGPLTPEQLQILGDAIEKRRQQIINWYNNHKNRNRDAQTLPASITAAIAQPDGPRRRCPQAREVYCRLYYDAEKRKVVKGLLAEERARLQRKLTNQERLAISRGRIDAWYAAESEDVKAAVLAKLEDETQEMKAAPPPPPRDLTTRMPQEYQMYVSTGPVAWCLAYLTLYLSAIDRAPGLIQRLIQPVADDSGWVITVIGAGPCPDQGGEIRSFS